MLSPYGPKCATGTASSTQHMLVPHGTVGVSAANAWALGERWEAQGGGFMSGWQDDMRYPQTLMVYPSVYHHFPLKNMPLIGRKIVEQDGYCAICAQPPLKTSSLRRQYIGSWSFPATHRWTSLCHVIASKWWVKAWRAGKRDQKIWEQSKHRSRKQGEKGKQPRKKTKLEGRKLWEAKNSATDLSFLCH